MKILALLLLLLAAPVHAEDYSASWQELMYRSLDPLNGVKCYAYTPVQAGKCAQLSGSTAYCDEPFFGGTLRFQVKGAVIDNEWRGYFTIGGHPVGIMRFRTDFSVYRRPDRVLVLQHFTYEMLDGTVSSCDVTQYGSTRYGELTL